MRITPARCRPIAMIRSPAICATPISAPSTSTRKLRSTRPSRVADAPSTTNTVEKPSTKASDAVITRRRTAPSVPCVRSSSTDRPDTSER